HTKIGRDCRRKSFVFFVCFVVSLSAQRAAIPDAEALSAPTSQRLAAVHAAALHDGWAPQTAALRATAFRAYENDKLSAAQSWLDATRWAALLGQTEVEFVPRWAQAVQGAGVAHPNMPTRVETRARPLAAALRPPLQAWVIGDAGFSAEFFSV